MKTYRQLRNRLLKDRKVREMYKDLGPEFEIVALIIKKRLERGLTQQELASRIGTKQSAISRLESGQYNPSIDFLRKVAEALDARLKISLSAR